MNKSNTATLKLAYPRLYRESLSNFSQYGFQHGDGWYALVTELNQQLLHPPQTLAYQRLSLRITRQLLVSLF